MAHINPQRIASLFEPPRDGLAVMRIATVAIEPDDAQRLRELTVYDPYRSTELVAYTPSQPAQPLITDDWYDPDAGQLVETRERALLRIIATAACEGWFIRAVPGTTYVDRGRVSALRAVLALYLETHAGEEWAERAFDAFKETDERNGRGDLTHGEYRTIFPSEYL